MRAAGSWVSDTFYLSEVCSEATEVCATSCSSNEFTCHSVDDDDGSQFVDTPCVPVHWECDGEKDCRDGSDEEDCGGSTCASGQFTCSNKNCIPAAWACDEWPDCSDGSDEKDCGPDTKTTRRTSTPYTTTTTKTTRTTITRTTRTTTTKTTRPTTTYIPGSCEAVVRIH